MTRFKRSSSAQPVHSLAALAAAAATAAAVGITPGGGARAADLFQGQFMGRAAAIEAHGLTGQFGLGLGVASHESCPCTGTNGHIDRNKLSLLSVGQGGGVATAKENVSTAYGLKTATGATTQQTSKVSRLNLLGGLITAASIKAVASATATADTLKTDYMGSRIVNLVIAGHKIDGNVPPNTTIDVAGLGTVTVKYVHQATRGTQSTVIEVEMLRISVVGGNMMGLPAGSMIVLGEAHAGYARNEPKVALGGAAKSLAVSADAGAALNAAATTGADVAITNCAGTDGQTLTDSVMGVDVAGLLSLGPATTTAFGGPVGDAQVAQTTSQIGSLSLLGGLITADSVMSMAEESRVGHTSMVTSQNSTFVSLKIAGVPFGPNVPPNTTIALPGLGAVVLNEQPAAVRGHADANALHIEVAKTNSLGLPVGAQIYVNKTEAIARGF